MAIYFGSTQVGTREYTPDPPTPPTPTYTSAQYFKFNGNVLIAYTGSATDIVLPPSYSISTTTQNFNGVVVPTSAFSDADLFNGFIDYNIVVAPTGDPSNTSTYNTMNDVNDLYDVYGDYLLLISAADNNMMDLFGIDSLLSCGAGYPMLVNGTVVYDQSGLSDIIHSGITSVDFIGTGSVTSYIDGNDYTVTTIGENAISPARNDVQTSVTSVVVTDTYTTIDNWAFGENSQLLSVSISASVTSIGINIFINCRNLSTITVDSNNQYFDSRGNCNAIIRKSDNTLLFGCSGTTMPQSVTAIGQAAFYGAGITSTMLNDNITSIGSDAYSYSSITSIYFPQNLTVISDNAFVGCRGLDGLITVIPSQITTIEYSAFSGISFSNGLTIEGEVTYIGSGAFSLRNDQSITCKATVPPTIAQYPFGYRILPTVYVPSESVSAYQSAQYWSDMTIFPIPEE